MKGLTEDGFRARILRKDFVMTENEAVDLFFIFPGLADIIWKKGNAVEVTISGLNLTFKIKG